MRDAPCPQALRLLTGKQAAGTQRVPWKKGVVKALKQFTAGAQQENFYSLVKSWALGANGWDSNPIDPTY